MTRIVGPLRCWVYFSLKSIRAHFTVAGHCDPKLKPSGQTVVPEDVTQTGTTQMCTHTEEE